MRATKRFGVIPLLAGALLFLGCSKTGKRVEDFTPPADNARQALEAALNHWKAGGTPGSIPGTTPQVEVVDAKWKAAPKQLREFEIGGEESRGDASAPRYFKVKLTMASGPPQDVRYVVVGIDPLWVYREQDFDALSGAGK
jgi:hypothetical protein